jgi:hypothetical protein
MAQAINGVQQAGTDRAQRIAQMLEQRHLQVEMAAAAFAREDRRHADEVAKPGESSPAHTGENGGDGRGGHEGRSPSRPSDDEPSPPPTGVSGHLVDVTA